MTAAPEPPEPREARDLESRLEEIVGVIQELAALRFDARATVGTAGDVVDAVAAGVNSLGEELEAAFEEIEHRVADRTAELASATRELRRRALHDDLTGLPNRPAFWDRLSHRLRAADGGAPGVAVLFLDLDDFKAVNDTLGHARGDQLLVEVARRITGELRAGDTAARVGGDEFLVLLDDVATGEAAVSVARRINDALRAPIQLGDRRYSATCSIGVAAGIDGRTTVDAVVAAADAAMYEAKRRGRGLCVLHEPGARPRDAGRHDAASVERMATYDVNDAAVRQARRLIDDGTYDTTTEWSDAAPSTDDENRVVERDGYEGFGAWHLAIDPEASEDTKGRYAFPYGDFARVNRAALIHAKQRAAQNGHAEIEDAADGLLEHLDEVSGASS